MSTAHVNIVTLLSQTHFDKGRYAFSFDVTHKDNTQAVIEKREAEKQVYIEHECTAGGGRSPEIELHLNNGKCKIKFVVAGALKNIAPLEKGEDVLEYNESQAECRKLVTLAPTYDESNGDTGFIKFKINDDVKHTVFIHDVPTERDLSRSTSSTDSSFMNVSGSSLRSNKSNSGHYSVGSTAEEEIVQGYVKETYASTMGGGETSQMLQANPFSSLGDAVGGLCVTNTGPGASANSTVQVDFETAHDKIVCDESLSALAAALPPSQANMLVISLGVPSGTREQNQTNHPRDVVTAAFHSLKYWRSKKTSRQDLSETNNQELYEDLIKKLEDIGRSDIKSVIQRKVAASKKLEHDDFKLT